MKDIKPRIQVLGSKEQKEILVDREVIVHFREVILGRMWMN